MRTSFIAALLLVFASPCFAAEAADCSTFTWNMSHELTLFAGAAKPLSSGVNAGAAPQLVLDTVYNVDLHPLSDVTFPHPLGKAAPPEGGSGGVLKLHVHNACLYRITLDAPLWIDIVAGTELVTANGFQGRQPCTLIHKSVEWSLPADVDLIVQLAGPTRAQAKLALTRAPDAP
jgi:hypothetical protein